MKNPKKKQFQPDKEMKDVVSRSDQGQHGQGKRKKNSHGIWEFFCSVKLAVVIILVMVVACILGTFIVQGRSFDDYVARYGYGFATCIRILQFNNVFYSHWFSLLLVLLCANLICCTIKRWRNTFLQTGFILTHLSLVLILAGGVIKFQMGVKGGVNVYEGKSVDYFLTQEIGPQGNLDYKKKSLPFSIACDDFILEKNEPKFQLVTYVKDKDSTKILDPKLGKRQRVQGSGYKITVQDYISDAELLQAPKNTSEEPRNPAVLVKLYGSERTLADGWLLANEVNFYDDKEQDLRIEYLWLSSQQAYEDAVKTVEGKKAVLTVALAEQGIFKEYDLELHKVFALEGTNYSFEMLQYVLNYGDRRPLNEQPPNNPAVLVQINGPEGSETRWIFENFPDWDQHPAKYTKLKLTSSGVASAYRPENILRIYHAPGQKQTLVYIRDNQIVKTVPFEFEKKYSFSDINRQIMIEKYFPSFDFEKKVIKKSDQLGVPAVLVEVEGPKGRVSDWLFSNSQYATWYTDENFAILYESTGESIKHFISKLRIIKNGETVVEKSIKVNDPLKYEGYSIYQSSYDPEAGNYTGLQISTDPGIPVVFTGFGALCVGVVFIFYIKPFLRKKKKENEVE
ncbi:MAG: cytochrome c biogenesis protein ResB [Candidatus Brocadiaceae bacterium]|nr:cytochrome c biogenesis protein ResB [Candidatus Brocadiaceae bacterium]